MPGLIQSVLSVADLELGTNRRISKVDVTIIIYIKNAIVIPITHNAIIAEG